MLTIQDIISNKSYFKNRLYNFLLKLWQKIKRTFSKKSLLVFYPYQSSRTHPSFIRYYKYPAYHYANFRKAKYFHFINSPNGQVNHKPFILEPVDHPLAITGLIEPLDVILAKEKAIDLINNEKCRAIILDGKGQFELFSHYFLQSGINKVNIVKPGIKFKINQKVDIKFGEIKQLCFGCLASDYKSKGVDLILQAWSQSNARYLSKLILICPNVPLEVEIKLKDLNVILIKKAPLNEFEKSSFFKKIHILFAPFHNDGGATIVEGFEYGIPIITFRSQRSFINENLGWLIDVPFYYYDTWGYGLEWKTQGEFIDILSSEKKKGNFDLTVSDMVEIINSINCNKFDLSMISKNIRNVVENEFNIDIRNKSLSRLYHKSFG